MRALMLLASLCLSLSSFAMTSTIKLESPEYSVEMMAEMVAGNVIGGNVKSGDCVGTFVYDNASQLFMVTFNNSEACKNNNIEADICMEDLQAVLQGQCVEVTFRCAAMGMKNMTGRVSMTR